MEITLKSQKIWPWEHFFAHHDIYSFEQFFLLVFSCIIKNDGDISDSKVRGNTYISITYIGCLILNNALRFLENYSRYGKIFQTKIVWFGKEYKIMYHWFDLEWRRQGQIKVIFFKRNILFAETNSWYQKLFKTL